MFESFLSFDIGVFNWIANLFNPGANPFWDGFFTIITKLGDHGLIWILLGLALFIPNRTRKVGTVILGAMLFMLLINNIVLKNIFARPRPYALETEWWLFEYAYPGLIKFPSGHSFPSGHASGAFAGAMAWLLASRAEWVGKRARLVSVAGVVLAVLIAFSRVYVGVHYATDVIAGAVVGTVCALLSLLLLRLLEPKFDKANEPLAQWCEKRLPKAFH